MSEPKRCLLIVPPTGRFIREDRCQTPIEDLKTVALRPPIGLLYMAASMEQAGAICRVEDYPATGHGWEDLRAQLEEFRPDILILSVTTPSLAEDLKAAALAKEVLPHVLVGGKGAHFNESDATALSEYGDLDFCFRGEYERTARDLIERGDLSEVEGITFRRDGEIVRNPNRPVVDDLDSLPYPARHLIDNGLYVRPDAGVPQTTIITSRGCPYDCIFCLAPVIAGHKVRRRSAENILGEIRECVRRHGIREFLFRSDLFTANREWTLGLCDAIIESGVDVHWACNSRVDTLTPEVLARMKEAGCWLVAFGVESGSEELLRHMNKKADKAGALRAVRLCRETGVRSSVYFVIGLPWETRETFSESVSFAKELDPDFLEVFYAYPFKGTSLYTTAVREGLLQDGVFPVEAYSKPAMPTLTMSIEDLSGLRREMLRRFYLRPCFIIRTLWKARSPRVLLNYLKYGLIQLLDLVTHR